jgi:hypothetical protein
MLSLVKQLLVVNEEIESLDEAISPFLSRRSFKLSSLSQLHTRNDNKTWNSATRTFQVCTNYTRKV